MNDLHQLVRDVMLKEFGDSKNALIAARPTTASDPIQNIRSDAVVGLAFSGEFRELPNSFNITSRTSWCNSFISWVTSLSSSFSASVRGVGLFLQ